MLSAASGLSRVRASALWEGVGQGSSQGSASETSSPQDAGDPGHWPLRLSPRLSYAAEGPGGVAQGLAGASRTHLRSSLGCQSPSLLWQLKDRPSPSAQSWRPSRQPAPDAHGATQFKSSLWLWGQRSRKPGPGHPGRQKSPFAQVRSPKRPKPLDPAPALTIIRRLHKMVPPGSPRSAPRVPGS